MQRFTAALDKGFRFHAQAEAGRRRAARLRWHWALECRSFLLAFLPSW